MRLACTAFRFRFSKPLRLACTAFTFRFSKPLRLPCTAFALALYMCVLCRVARDGPDISTHALRERPMCRVASSTYVHIITRTRIALLRVYFRVGGVSALGKCSVQRDIHVHVHVYADVGA